MSFFFFFKFIFDCAGSLLLASGFLQLKQTGATLQLQCTGFSLQWLLLLQSMGFRACWLQQLWCIDLVAPWHMESSWTRDQTWVLCIGRQIFNHQTIREVLYVFFGEISVQIFCLFFNCVVFFFLYTAACWSVALFANIFFHPVSCLHFPYGFFCCAEVFKFNQILFVCFYFYFHYSRR